MGKAIRPGCNFSAQAQGDVSRTTRKKAVMRQAKRDLPDPAVGRPPRSILSIDGGGIRGIIPAVILADIEKKTGKHTTELFDMIAGTSTGALIALALATPGQDGRPMWTAQDIVEMYDNDGPSIFHRSLWQCIKTAGGIGGARYDQKRLLAPIEKYVGETRLKEALVDILIPTYDLQNREPFFFRSERARSNPAKDFPMMEVAAAATAAPTYFPPKTVVNDVSHKQFQLVDGGIFANNPSMCAITDLDRYGTSNEALILSIGTGSQTDPIKPNNGSHGWGLIGWAPKILDVVFDSVSDATDYQLWEKMGDQRYLRLQTDLDVADDALDAASPKNLALLKKEALEALQVNAKSLDAFLTRLQAHQASSPPPDSAIRKASNIRRRSRAKKR